MLFAVTKMPRDEDACLLRERMNQRPLPAHLVTAAMQSLTGSLPWNSGNGDDVTAQFYFGMFNSLRSQT